jgi:hypothetical protein
MRWCPKKFSERYISKAYKIFGTNDGQNEIYYFWEKSLISDRYLQEGFFI